MVHDSEGRRRVNKINIVLFLCSIALVIVALVISLNSFKRSTPSITAGSSSSEIGAYAEELLYDNYSVDGYNKSLEYYQNQIDAASSNEDRFNLTLDLAKFYGENGDTSSGYLLLDEYVTDDLPKDAKYYYYATYIYLCTLDNDSDCVDEMRAKMNEENIDEYFAEIDREDIDEKS